MTKKSKAAKKAKPAKGKKRSIAPPVLSRNRRKG